MDLERLGGLDPPLGHCWGQLDSILGHQVAPQSYGGLTITRFESAIRMCDSNRHDSQVQSAGMTHKCDHKSQV